MVDQSLQKRIKMEILLSRLAHSLMDKVMTYGQIVSEILVDISLVGLFGETGRNRKGSGTLVQGHPSRRKCLKSRIDNLINYWVNLLKNLM